MKLWPSLGVLVSCGLYAASFPPLGLAPLAWIALTPLLLSSARVGPVAGAASGLLWGVGSATLLTGWLPAAIARFFEVPDAQALAATAGIFLFCALPYAALGAWLGWRARRGGASPFAVALAWAGCEAVRVYGPFETAWGLLAYSQASNLTIVQSADLFGALGLGAAIAFVNAGLASGVTGGRGSRGHLVASGCVLVALLAYGTIRLAQDLGSDSPVTVAVVQGGIAPDAGAAAAREQDRLSTYLELTRTARSAEPQLVLWPELVLRSRFEERPDLLRSIREASRALDGELLLGAPVVRTRLLVRELLNAYFLFGDGHIEDRHDKVSLMPFSEMRPALLPLGRDVFLPGLELRPLASRSGALGVMLCSEVLNPGLARALSARGARWLANPSNDDWFGTPAAVDHQLAAAVLRAVENRRPLLRPSTSGRSAIIDAHGRLLAVAPYGEPTVLHASLRPARGVTLYAWFAGLPTGASLSGLALAIAAWWVVRRRSNS